MPESGIVLEGAWKKFRRGELHDSLRDLLPALAKRIMGRRRPADELEEGAFWAVQDLSFSVGPGETLGIIGGNGAGKSTTLKMITKILRPTRGRCEVRGRIGALIEIAAGFHPDLTGRENVFLQGAIRGMPRARILRQFDNIVEFSGISEFIDTPVKRYSSGMNARLGFSVAAHLEPEVLIIDEVLSVGDFSFQIKAFDRLKLMASSGIPVVIVSHQLDRVASLCTRAIFLDHGRVVHDGTPAECIARYIEGKITASTGDSRAPISIETVRARSELSVESGAEVAFEVGGIISEGPDAQDHGVGIEVRSTQTGMSTFFTTTDRLGVPLPASGRFLLSVSLQLNLPPAVYLIESVVFSRRLARKVTNGPTIAVSVVGGPNFLGTVQLNPRMKLGG